MYTPAKKVYTIMAFSTLSGKTVYRVLTNGCLETTRGAAQRRFKTREAAEAWAKACAKTQI